MSVEENRALIQRWIDYINAGDGVRAFDDLFAPDHLYHADHPAEPGLEAVQGREDMRGIHQLFPDLRVVAEDLIAEGDKVVMRWAARGTLQVEIEDMPAGQQATIRGIDVYHLADGKIVEWWRQDDDLLETLRRGE